MNARQTGLELEYADGERAIRTWENPILIRRGDDTPLAIQNGTDRQDCDAMKFIVRAVNAHDDLVKACERLLIEITTDGGRIGICSKYGEASWRESVEITRAALAKARGE